MCGPPVLLRTQEPRATNDTAGNPGYPPPPEHEAAHG
jgi:hypothetical protein